MNDENEESLSPLKSTDVTANASISMVQKRTTDIFQQQSALPSFGQQCRFEWKHLNVFVGNDKNRKQILYNCNGSIQSGELLAVMGGSGAGKSTLLNALSGRTNLGTQTLHGNLAINEQKLHCSEQATIKSLCTYVPQSDILCPTQTVQEALNFYANLKLSHKAQTIRTKRVNYLIDVLHLNKCRNSCIGDETKRGISGGEKRRVSIASEILNDADIIFLDEPTSGLDAYTAARTIKTLKQFCSVSNKIIIATIHQPAVQVFYLFDKLILLSNGKCCFNSSLDDIEIFFKDSLKPKTNPADVIVFEVQRNAHKYATKWYQSSLNTIAPQHDWDDYKDFNINLAGNEGIKTNGKMAAIYQQQMLLLKREIKGLIRNKRLSILRILQIIFFALLCGLCYYDVKESYDQRMRAIFLMVLIVILFGIVTLLTVFPQQKLLFQREYNSGTFNIIPWALTFVIVEIPREMIHMLLFLCIAYFMIGLGGVFVKYWFTFLLTAISGGSLGMLFGTVCRTTVEAAQATPAALIPLLIFSDSIIRLKNLPSFLIWIAYINPLYYLFRCLYIIEFYGVVFSTSLSTYEKAVCNVYDIFMDLELEVNINSTAVININANWVNVGEYSFTDCFVQERYGANTDLTGSIVGDIDLTDIDFFTEALETLETFCSGKYPYTYFFNQYGLEVNSLTTYWLIVVLICFLLRLISIVILLCGNNRINCRCKSLRRDVNDEVNIAHDSERTGIMKNKDNDH